MVSNRQLATVFHETAALYEINGERFKSLAYARAAEELASLGEEVVDIVTRDGAKGLQAIPGVGQGIAAHIVMMIKKGTFPEYVRMKKKLPVHIERIMRVGSIGPKKVKVLYDQLKIRTLRDLEKAARVGKIRNIPGFGKASEDKILRGIAFVKKNTGRFWIGEAQRIAGKIKSDLKAVPGTGEVTIAGSYRRAQETVGDLDILVISREPKKIRETFTTMRDVEQVLAQGPTKSMVQLHGGMQVDLRVVPKESYGAALQYFTGDKDHNVALRKIAIARGMKLNEYGLWRGKKQIAGANEHDIYHALRLAYIEPELRTMTGELEAAAAEFKTKKPHLPKLVPYGSIRGDLQTQTLWTDGSDTIADMAAAAKKYGLEYIAITDHTRALALTGGLDEKKLARQGKEIDKLNAKEKSGFHILKGAEVNVLKDGSLDIADSALAKLDVVSIAVHAYFKLPVAEQTERIIRAMKNPHVNILFHPTGRIVNKRDPYEVDMAKIIRASIQYGVALEINSSERMDLRDVYIRQAVEAGAKFVIDTDAHATEHFDFLSNGIGNARRGWVTKKDVLNTLSCEEFLKALKGLKKK